MKPSAPSTDPAVARSQLIESLFPQGVPRLWCPLLTHFSSPGRLDIPRMEAHLAHLAPHVRGLLVPGSTGEGWEMNDDEIADLLGVVLKLAEKFGLHVLVGVLKTTTQAMREGINRIRFATEHPSFVGITICPPQGRDKTQLELTQSVAEILELGIPTALYQLPQVTLNEMTAETVQELCLRYANLFMFKDTSGQDRVATSGLDFKGLFLVRGAEAGGYAKWLRASGGTYDGFLLSTANVFAATLSKIIDLSLAGNAGEAVAVSENLSTAVASLFASVIDHPVGNPFTNANKLGDHLMAFANDYRHYPAPMLYGGSRLPAMLLESAWKTLEAHGLQPSKGYMKQPSN